MGSGSYSKAQVCVNGHVVNDWTEAFPEKLENYCHICGAKTIMNCQKCSASIRGFHHVPGVISLSHYVTPRFCHNCGEPFPWTESRLKAAKELVGEATMLSSTEKEELSMSIEDMVMDTPNAQVATVRYKRLITKAGQTIANGARDIIVDIVSESIKKALWG